MLAVVEDRSKSNNTLWESLAHKHFVLIEQWGQNSSSNNL